MWNGIEYRNKHEAAAALEITYAALLARLEKGYTCDDDLGKSIWPSWTLREAKDTDNDHPTT